MYVLILEDDPMMRELLCTIVQSQNPSAVLLEAETLEEAQSQWEEHKPGLLLCDWTLPQGEDGLDLVRHIRKTDRETPILMVTGRGDRQSVISSARQGVDDFIVKPFDPTEVGRRLQPYLIPDGMNLATPEASLPALGDWLAPVDDRVRNVTLMTGARDALGTLTQDEEPTARELNKRWRDSPTITSRLIQIANSSLFKRYGKAVNNLLDAINAMGVTMALNQVVALSMNDHDSLRHPHLKLWADHYAEESQAIADTAADLANRLKIPVSLAYTAGLLHRLGEITLLQLIQHYLDQGGHAVDHDIDSALTHHAQAYGNAIKTHWQLPLDLRERVGATHWLATDAVRRELILMSVAASRAKGDTSSATYLRRLRALGLEG
ncbi:response regulator [Saccharospirillum salsuginis]|uniref:Response regulator n=1 Tax=Saccharospirillum salsuginis TaxID=418750 RepID=A0A918NJR0_9GAMM|nr:response regulator [Saccharospirillum salsuginis]GGX75873.1 response regulator [Saccharospirillum salsuginis]